MESYPKLNDVEKKIVSARLSGLSFCELAEPDMEIVAATIIARGTAMTGCSTPQTEFSLQILRQEIIVFILEFGYMEFTESEIQLAMRLNSKAGLRHPSGLEIDQIDFKGLTFNIDYFAKVLNNYSLVRKHLDRKFENMIDGY